jgi:tetratricopeptide (TPR) repeat protein
MIQRASAVLLFAAAAFAQSETDFCDRTQVAALREQSSEAMNARQFDLAAAKLKQAIAVCPLDQQLLLDLAGADIKRRDFDAAIGEAQNYLRGNPRSAAGRVMLADAYFMAGRLKEAQTLSSQILETDAGNSAALKIRANSRYLLGDFAGAKDDFIDLMERHPTDEDAPYMLGRMYYQEGNEDLARGQFERVLRLNPSAYKALDGLGLCYEAVGDNARAIHYFLASIRLVEKDHPEYDQPYADLAELLLRSGDNQKAWDAAAKAANRNPSSARNFYLGGKALYNLGKTDLSLKWLQRSAALDPSFPQPLYLLALAYHRLGEEDKAADARQKFREAHDKTSHKTR